MNEAERQMRKSRFMALFGAVMMIASTGLFVATDAKDSEPLQFWGFMTFVGFSLWTVGSLCWFTTWADEKLVRRYDAMKKRWEEKG